jgi:pSer/pThr/pTyr-binding forkhead associated (FHA) protein
MTLASRRAHGVVSAGVAPFPDDGVASIARAALSRTGPSRRANHMPVIKVDNQQYSLRPGPNRLGAGDGVDLNVDGDATLGVQAIVDLGANAQAVIRRAGQAVAVRVNGIALVDPTPLMHGDKVEIGGKELLFAEDAKVGNTAFVSAAEIAAIAQKRPGTARATSATGGRLVSLVDGKEYSVPSNGITIGRDASAGVVVAENEVSRKHAEIIPVDAGYELRDYSANGLFVNGARVERVQMLSRSDVIRVGTEEFRFYADLRPAAPTPGPVTAVPVVGPVASAVAPVVSPATAAGNGRSEDAVSDPPAAAAHRDPRSVLATLEVTSSGIMKGKTYEIHVPLAHVGRGSHNDIVITDDSVSETHAKLQRRDDGWYVIDAGSTNGTYVGGQRLSAERRLDGAPDVRFGGIKVIFRSADVHVDAVSETRPIASVDRMSSRPAEHAPRVPTAESADPTSSPPARPNYGLSVWVWIVVGLAILAAGAIYTLNR